MAGVITLRPAAQQLPPVPPMATQESNGHDGLIEDLVAANRALAMQNILDAWGHVSVRDDRNPNRYIIARSLAPELVTAADMMEFDLDSNPLDRRGPDPVRPALHVPTNGSSTAKSTRRVPT